MVAISHHWTRQNWEYENVMLSLWRKHHIIHNKESPNHKWKGWILQLQDGSIDLLGLQGCYKQISPLQTELKSLVWALKCLSRHQQFFYYFVTDSQELVKMIATPEDQPAFAAELNEFKSLWTSYQDRQVVYQDRFSNTQADFLARHARTRNHVFSHVNTSVPYWIDTSNSFHGFRTKIYLCTLIVTKKHKNESIKVSIYQ